MNEPRPAMISARPPESRSSVANCWNTRTGSSELSTRDGAREPDRASCARPRPPARRPAPRPRSRAGGARRPRRRRGRPGRPARSPRSGRVGAAQGSRSYRAARRASARRTCRDRAPSSVVRARRPAPLGRAPLCTLALVASPCPRPARGARGSALRLGHDRLVHELDEALLGRAPVAQLGARAGRLDAELAAVRDAVREALLEQAALLGLERQVGDGDAARPPYSSGSRAARPVRRR